MQRAFVFALIVVGTLALAGPAEAQTACVDWICFPHNGLCEFDASCSAGPGETPIVFEYDWDDGSDVEYTFEEEIDHTYASPQAFATVNLNVGFLLIGYDDVDCNIQIRPVCCVPELFYSGTCS